ncbi:MFS transporter, DHA2 family, multidrug resistance protein [Saccharopolyspora antimicrobica]|uniref:DHA2 family multidrug resistance protein-like MFS transporter n=1 Tax=Saccharopolyspora antimicrobica TaxID=455193 RepID=A0A1I4QTY9_9PSEU|nr:DHA2 family multidrug resistance protein-like MFS transporter [Saccharopolyspora antimicrobica]SFM43491.1 MFS transporter, DHA2 family, multidrug resistance protein [Saccharopolyspora antimicrobica]
MNVGAGKREWTGLAVLALPTVLLSLDVSVLHLAVPQLAADLMPSSSELLWIVDGYGFLIAGFLITMGTLGDRIGRRKLLMIGSAAFGAASIAAAFAPTPTALIAARSVLGVAGATLMPSTLALISNLFQDARQRRTAIAVWMSAFMGGMVIGPVVGGLLLEHFWWGSVFLLGVPVMVLLLLTAPALLPEHRDEHAGRLDLVSVALSLGTILPIVFSLKETAKHGPQPAGLTALAAGLVLGAVFVRRQRHLADPMLDLRLLRNRAVGVALGVMLIGAVILGGITLLVSQYLQLVAALSAFEAGVLLAPQAVAVVVGSLLAPWLAARFQPGFVLGSGMLVAAAGLLLFSQVRGDGLVLVVVGISLAAFGMGPQGVFCTEMVIGSVPPRRAGAASAMTETIGEFGIAMGIAVFGSIATAVYRDEVALPPLPTARCRSSPGRRRPRRSGSRGGRARRPAERARPRAGCLHQRAARGRHQQRCGRRRDRRHRHGRVA